MATDRTAYYARPLEVTERTKELARPWVDDVDVRITEWNDFCVKNPRLARSRAEDVEEE